MPVKIARSAPRASFGLQGLLIASTPRVSLATRPGRREYSRQFGSHTGVLAENYRELDFKEDLS